MSNSNSFEDPLENYDPKNYSDALEKAIAEESVLQIQHRPHAHLQPDATVEEALQKLASDHVSCVLIQEAGKLLGMFTNREVLNKVALEPEMLSRPVRDAMTSDPTYVRDDDPIAAALCVMAVHGYRHVPIVDADMQVLGIVSPQRVLKFLADQIQ